MDSKDEQIQLEKSLYRKKLIQSTLALSFYMIISIGLIFINRIILTSKTKTGVLFMSWYQFVVALVIMLFLSQVSKYNGGNFEIGFSDDNVGEVFHLGKDRKLITTIEATQEDNGTVVKGRIDEFR